MRSLDRTFTMFRIQLRQLSSKLCWIGNYKLASSGRCYSINHEDVSKKWSYFHRPGTTLLAETLGQAMDKAAKQYGDNEAVVFCESNIRKSFYELKKDIDKFAAGLIAIGLKKGERIGIWSPNRYEWIVTQYAAAKAGLILVNINPAYQARELEFAVKKVGMRALVCPDKFKTQNYYEILKNVLPLLPNSSPGQIKDRISDFSHVIIMSDKDYGGTFKFSDVSNAADNSHFQELDKLEDLIQFDDPYNIQFTSGTTGTPKAATLSHFNFVNNSEVFAKSVAKGEKGHRLCIPVPLFHSFAFGCGSVTAIRFGWCQVYPGSGFSAKETAEAVTKEKCTSLYGTPTMYIDIMNLSNIKDYDFGTIQGGSIGGATCPVELLKATSTKLKMQGISNGYGSTETSPVISTGNRHMPLEIRATTVGRLIENLEAKVVNPVTRNIVPLEEIGELYIRGPTVMLGYWNDPEKTKEAIGQDRWYKTGDLATLSEDGYIKLVGRCKDVIIRGGENIYPKEIEDFFHTHPKIAEAHVFGVPDERLGEESCVWIQLKSGKSLTEKEVKEFCKEIAVYKTPRYVKFVDSFPRTAAGKVQKMALRDLSIAELGLK